MIASLATAVVTLVKSFDSRSQRNPLFAIDLVMAAEQVVKSLQ